MSIKDNQNQSINQELLNLFTNMVEETRKLYNNLENIINGESIMSAGVKQELKGINEYIDYAKTVLKKIEDVSLNLNSNEQTILSKIKEEFNILKDIRSLCSVLSKIEDIADNKKVNQANIADALGMIACMLGIDDDKQADNAEQMTVERTDSGIIVHTSQGKCIIEGDIANVQIVL